MALSGDGNTALIGAPYDNGNGGSATVFDRSGTTWAQVAEFSPSSPDGENGASGFGISVALSADGDTALIGGSTDSNGSGAAWIYTQSGGDWTQGQALLPNDEQNSDGQFGYAVALVTATMPAQAPPRSEGPPTRWAPDDTVRSTSS